MVAENFNMLELAKKLVPSIEEGMPEDVAQAFAEGKIKTIFRTADSVNLSIAAKLGKSRIGRNNRTRIYIFSP